VLGKAVFMKVRLCPSQAIALTFSLLSLLALPAAADQIATEFMMCSTATESALIRDASESLAAESLSDREPEDPAEFRIQRLPPPRPVSRANAATWQALGPMPTESAQVNVPPDDEVSGAVQSIATHPVDADIVYIGAVNGGIWKTSNATAAQPTWIAQSEILPSQSIGAIEFDPIDATHQTLIAGTGRWSNFANRGDDQIGVYRTVNGGDSWTLLGETALLGKRISEVSARGAVLMAATTSGGLFRSIDTGANWTQISGSAGLPVGNTLDLAADPGNTQRFYVSVDNTIPSILRSDDGGASWVNISAGISALADTTNNMRLSVGAAGVVYLAVVNSGSLAGVYRSSDLGANWIAMDTPSIHPGGQGSSNTAIIADPANANRVYIGGDRLSTSPFTANIVRGDFTASAGNQFVIAMDAGAGGTAPHADSRDMTFDVNGELLESDDGGIYRRTLPGSSSGTWRSMIGNLNVTEVHDLAYDWVSNVIMIGTQDNGTHIQRASSNPRWLFISSGDGGDAAIDDTSLGFGGSYRYTSSQNLGSFRRRQYDASNNFQSSQGMPGIVDPQFVTPLELSRVDNSRLLVGGSDNVYESTNANTPTPTLNSLGAPGANRNAMAFGALGMPGAAVVGKSNAVFKRVGDAFVATAELPAGAATITDVAMNPEDTDILYAIDNNQVFFTDDGGATWQDLTGNLHAISSDDFRTIEFIPADVAAGKVAIGTRSGVYESLSGSNVWSLLGQGLPDVLVFDLRYVGGNESLIAGTLGRGVWQLSLKSDLIFADGFE
jgi:hypothetical protein